MLHAPRDRDASQAQSQKTCLDHRSPQIRGALRPFSAVMQSGSGTRRPSNGRTCARTALCDETGSASHPTTTNSLFELRDDSGCPTARRGHPAALRQRYRERKVLQRFCRPSSQSARTLLVRKRGTGDAVPRHRGMGPTFRRQPGGTAHEHPHALVSDVSPITATEATKMFQHPRAT